MKFAALWSVSVLAIAVAGCAPIDDDEPAPPETVLAALQVSCAASQGQRVVTVARDGSGEFKSVQAAINAVAGPALIHIKPGKYKEQLTIDKARNLTLCGDDPKTTILTFDRNVKNGGSLADNASVRVSANDFSAANLTFENSSPLGVGQAVALVASGQHQQFVNCRFVSYQDTLYTKSGTQYFRDSFIQGNTDFVFGAASAVFENCQIHSASQGSAVTAPSTEPGTAYGLVFLGGRLTAASGVPARSVALGRPWRPNGAAAFLNVSLGGHIRPEGWVEMSGNPVRGARFSEYRSTGSGANPGARASGTRQLSDSEAKRYTVSNVLGWTPSYAR